MPRCSSCPRFLEYEAVWWSNFGLGTRWWSAPGTTYPGTVLGIGYRYPVPKGYAAWSAAYGDCAAPAKTYGVSAWGVTDRWEVGGYVTYAGTGKPAAGVSTTATARAVIRGPPTTSAITGSCCSVARARSSPHRPTA